MKRVAVDKTSRYSVNSEELDSTAGPRSVRPSPLSEWINVPPVFIVGAPRSGTTLLRLMLTAHPMMSISSEALFIGYLRSILSPGQNLPGSHDLVRIHEHILPLLTAEKFFDLPALDDLLEWTARFGSGFQSLVTFYGTWEARGLNKTHLMWWGDNAPYHGHHIPFLVSMFPACRFILMIRDPRDSCASTKINLPHHTFQQAVMEWEQILVAGLLALSDLGPQKIIQVRYEDLVQMPREMLNRICSFLNVKFTGEMLSFYNLPAAARTAELRHHRNILKPVFTDSVGKYRKILTPDEILSIHESLYTPMKYYGYLSDDEYEKIGSAVLSRRIQL
jgi:sulfotransferase family protein